MSNIPIVNEYFNTTNGAFNICDVEYTSLTNKFDVFRYNSKTYLVTDIDFTVSPASSFESRDGSVKYKDYYQKVMYYNDLIFYSGTE